MMLRYASALAVALITFCWQTSVEGVFVKFQVQLALSNDEYSSSGFVYGDIEENPLLFSKLTWDRPELSASERETFAALVRSNGSISAIEYRVSCQAPPADLPADWSQAQQVAVICRFPETVAPMRQIAQPGLEPSGLPEGSTIYPESHDAAQGGGPSSERKKMPVKDERSWIMKNWMFLVPAGMLLVNILGAGDTQPAARPGQTAAQGPSAAAPAVVSGQGSASGARSRKKR